MDKAVDMFDKVSRYDWDTEGMNEDSLGDYVSYDDYQVLLEECDSLRGAVKIMIQNMGVFSDE
jgi:hypothetical protein